MKEKILVRLASFLSAVALWSITTAASAQTTVEYIHTDALGTPVAVTDATGVVIERSEYEPYGQLVNRPLTGGPGFTGHVQDAATGLTYMQQRYYDPLIGRFLSVDPVTAYSMPGANFNRYWYANNNPYKYSDPDGRQADSVIDDTREQTHGQSLASLLLGWLMVKAAQNAQKSEQSGGEQEDESGSSEKPSVLDEKARNHILNGDGNGSGGHRAGTGIPGKSEFPESWSDEKIEGEISDIVTDPETVWSKPDSRGYIVGKGTRDGIDIKVVYDNKNGRVVTGFPTNTPRNEW